MTDFLVVVLKQILEVRSDLKLILMSASLDSGVFSRYFEKSPVVSIVGRSFEVNEMYLEQVLEMTSFDTSKVDALESGDTNMKLVAKLVHQIHNDSPIGSGAILVFLTGWDEIDNLNNLLVYNL